MNNNKREFAFYTLTLGAKSTKYKSLPAYEPQKYINWILGAHKEGSKYVFSGGKKSYYIQNALDNKDHIWLLIRYIDGNSRDHTIEDIKTSNKKDISKSATGPFLDDIDLTINSVVEGDFFGHATLTLRTNEAKEAYSKADRSYILLGGVHASSFMPQFPNWLDLKPSGPSKDDPVLITENGIRIYDSGDDFGYPFDSYLIELSFDMQMYYGKGTTIEVC